MPREDKGDWSQVVDRVHYLHNDTTHISFQRELDVSLSIRFPLLHDLLALLLDSG